VYTGDRFAMDRAIEAGTGRIDTQALLRFKDRDDGGGESTRSEGHSGTPGMRGGGIIR
jgi:hypothetical protein